MILNQQHTVRDASAFKYVFLSVGSHKRMFMLDLFVFETGRSMKCRRKNPPKMLKNLRKQKRRKTAVEIARCLSVSRRKTAYTLVFATFRLQQEIQSTMITKDGEIMS